MKIVGLAAVALTLTSCQSAVLMAVPEPLPEALPWSSVEKSGGFLGLQTRENDSGSLEDLFFSPGVRVVRVIENSPAAAIGIEPSDILLRFDGEEVNDPGALDALVGARAGGDSVKLEVSRDDTVFELTVELAAAGAPAELVERCRVAADEEVRHAEAMGRLAGRPAVVAPMPTYSHRGLEELAVENAVEGCVRELVGAAFGVFQGVCASDADVREAMAVLGADEVQHAALSFDIHRWLAAQLDRAALERVRQAMRRAVGELEATDPPPGLRLAGLPDSSQARVLIDELRPAWVELAEAA